MPERSTRAAIVLRLLLAGACLGVYARSFGTPFFFDDVNGIVENPHVRTLWPITEAMGALPDRTTSGRPLVALTLAVNHAIGGLDPASYHAFNLALHAGCALLLMGIVERALRSVVEPRRAEWLAFAVTAIWAVHPLGSETVVYVSQRTELLFAFLLLVTLACFARGAGLRAVNGSRAAVWFVAAVAACALGMLAKEVMAVAPLLVLLYDRAALSGSFPAAVRRHGWAYAGLVATWGVLAVVVWTNTRSASAGFGSIISPAEYLFTQAGVIVHYLRLCFWPHPLSVIYHWPFAESVAEVWPQGLVVLALLGVTAYGLWRNALWGLAGAWFFVILGPTSSIVPIVTEPVAERRMYLPLVAVIAVVVVAVARELERRRMATHRPVVPAALLAVVVAVLGIVTMLRVEDYRTEQSIWESAAAAQPNHPVALNDQAIQMAMAGRTEEALAKLNLALRIDRGGSELRVSRGVLLARLGRVAEAETDLREAMRQRPALIEASVNLAALLIQQGRTEEARPLLERAARLRPNDEAARSLLQRIEP